MCGSCCLAQGCGLKIVPGDYKRWRQQGRQDILRYAWIAPRLGSYGGVWMDPELGNDLSFCPFLKKISQQKYVCTIHDTKPKACKDFWCEWSYGVGNKGIPSS